MNTNEELECHNGNSVAGDLSLSQLKEFFGFSHGDVQLCLSTIESRLPDGLLPQLAPHLEMLTNTMKQGLAQFHQALADTCVGNGAADEATSDSDHWNIMLPIELQVKIFSYLSLTDRKTCRLVCKSWRKTSWCRELIQDDWLTITVSKDGHQSLEDIMNALREAYECSDMIPINLRFRPSPADLPAMDIERVADEKFWKHFGKGIENLVFEKGCRSMTIRMLRLILKSCCALKSFSFLGDFAHENVDRPCPAKTVLQIKQNVASLSALRITEIKKLKQADPLWELVSHLNELDIQLYDSSANEQDQHNKKLATVMNGFLALRELTVSIKQNNFQGAKKTRELLSQHRFPLKGIRLFTTRNDVAMEICQLLEFHSKSIEYLKVNTEPIYATMGVQTMLPDTTEEQFFHSISSAVLSLQNLKQLSLFPDERRHTNGIAMLAYQALLYLPHLTALHLKCFTSIATIPNALFANMPSLPTDLSLRELRIAGFPMCDQLFHPDSGNTQMVANLSRLELCFLSDLSDEMVQHICLRCMSLESLIIDRCGQVTDAALLYYGDPNSLLEHPSLPAQGQKDRPPPTAFSTFRLAASTLLKELKLCGKFTSDLLHQLSFSDQHSLKILCLQVTQCSDEALLQLAKFNSGLEEFILSKRATTSDFDKVSLNGQLELVRHCTRLRNFSSSSLHAGTQLRKQMKQLCPALHYINGITLLD